MAGSGPLFEPLGYGGPWLSGPGDWMTVQTERAQKFKSNHPEWDLALVKSLGRYEASKGNHDTGLTIMTDPNLESLLNRLEAQYGPRDV